MTEQKLHRWEYNENWFGYKCVDPPLGSVDSGQRCWPGCGAVVPDRLLYQYSPGPLTIGVNTILDMIWEKHNDTASRN